MEIQAQNKDFSSEIQDFYTFSSERIEKSMKILNLFWKSSPFLKVFPSENSIYPQGGISFFSGMAHFNLKVPRVAKHQFSILLACLAGILQCLDCNL